MKKQKKISFRKQVPVFVVSAYLFLFSLWGLDPENPIDGYLVDKWEINQGLPTNKIRAISQTPDGYLWIATSKALVRYDGSKFSIDPIVNPDKNNRSKPIVPHELFLDRTGILWIGSYEALTSYDYKTGRTQAFPFTGADGVRRINGDIKGNLWIAFHNNDINRFFKGKFTAYNAKQGLTCQKINTIIEDHKGNILLGARESGVFCCRDDTFSKYPVKDIENLQVLAMQEDCKGNLWVGTVQGLFKVTGLEAQRYTIADGLADNFISYILEDSERNLWIGTLKGLNRIKEKENERVQIEKSPLPFIVSSIFEDREKNLWVGTDNDGLIRFKDGKFLSYKPLEANQGETLTAIYEDTNKDIWIGTLKGKLFHCRGRNIIETIQAPELADVGIVAIAEDDQGNLWLGTIDKGVFQRKKGTFTRYTRETTQNGLSDNTVTSIYRDSNNHLWLSTFGGLSVIRTINNQCVIESFTSQGGLLAKTVNNVYEDKTGNIWVAADKGLTILSKAFTGGVGGPFSPKESPLPAEANLEDLCVTCIYHDVTVPAHEGDVFWIATQGAGLKRLKLKNGKFISSVSYTSSEGMTTNNIYQFLEDRDGFFWLMSDSGVLRVKKSELVNFTGKDGVKINCISYDQSDGLKGLEFSNKFSRNSILKTVNGEFWFLTDKGISIVNPEKIHINKTAPQVKIEAISINQVNIDLHREPGAYVFKGNSDFSVQFTAPTFLSPEKIKFKYRLEGFDKEWLTLAAGKERTLFYKNLKPGTYIFKVIACNSDGVWEQEQTGDAITFTIKPYFHQTIFFKIILFLLMIIPSAAGYYLYKKYLFKKNHPEEKKKYQGALLDSKISDDCVGKLKHLMEVEKVYRDEEISLQTLAQMIPTTPHVLSQVLNEKLNRNFSDFINSYRVEEAMKLLASPGGRNKKNWIIAHDVGFNNMGVFYKAFKKYTDMTPNEYKKKQEPRTNTDNQGSK